MSVCVCDRDEAVCFAIQKGLQASRSDVRYFRHNDTAHLQQLLDEHVQETKKAREGRKTGGQTGTLTHIPTDRYTNRQTDTHTDTYTNRQIDKGTQTYRYVSTIVQPYWNDAFNRGWCGAK